MIPSPYSNNGLPLTLGILGGGQLAKMLAQSAYRMGLRVAVIEHGANSPAGMLTHLEFSDGWTNTEALQKFIAASDIVTLENEFIDIAILEAIAEKRAVFPAPATVALVQDKLTQKETFAAAGIPVTPFSALASPAEAVKFGEKHGFPFIVKTRTLGYDGYGNATVQNAEDCSKAFSRFIKGGIPRKLMGEKFARFTKELAVMVARNRRGETAVYPCAETIQERHICRMVLSPAPIKAELQRRAQEIALACIEAVGGVGIFGVEMFLTEDGEILFNEIAPRPHNSGHYTIEACHCSQFENAVRAVCNLPLGSPEMTVPAAAMINLLGERRGAGTPDSVTDMLRFSKASLHLYGKSESRPGRKMGHITVAGNSLDEVRKEAEEAAEALIW